jgi:hypothetical protein
MYTTSSASSSGLRTSRILSLKIALAAVMSSVMTEPSDSRPYLRCMFVPLGFSS